MKTDTERRKTNKQLDILWWVSHLNTLGWAWLSDIWMVLILINYKDIIMKNNFIFENENL